jgi:DUF1680 family protein
LRWHGGRQEYIRLSNCCPPNTVRTIAEVNNYAYSISDSGVWINLYGSNKLNTQLKDGSDIQLSQQSNYPWEGRVQIKIDKTAAKSFSLYLRIPGWCRKATIRINGKSAATAIKSEQYAVIHRNWSAGDVVTLDLDMPPTLIESHPMVEETRNQVAVKRGPVVYCLESADFPKGTDIFNVIMPAKNDLRPVKASINNFDMMALEGTAYLQKKNWKEALYTEVNSDRSDIKVRLIPYYAWSNRGVGDMTVWMLLGR